RSQCGLIDPGIVDLQVNADRLAAMIDTRHVRYHFGRADYELADRRLVEKALELRGENHCRSRKFLRSVLRNSEAHLFQSVAARRHIAHNDVDLLCARG